MPCIKVNNTHIITYLVVLCSDARNKVTYIWQILDIFTPKTLFQSNFSVILLYY